MTAEELWALIAENQGKEYRTARGMGVTYHVPTAKRGENAGKPSGELFIQSENETVWSRKSITKATFFRAYQTAKEIQNVGVEVTGPKQLKVFGKTYQWYRLHKSCNLQFFQLSRYAWFWLVLL